MAPEAMKPDVKERWVEALRSGEYQQGTGRVRMKGRYCCLGVLTALAEKELGPDVWRNTEGIALSPKVAKWAGLVKEDGTPIVSPHLGLHRDLWLDGLSNINDFGTPFNDIADMIERSL